MSDLDPFAGFEDAGLDPAGPTPTPPAPAPTAPDPAPAAPPAAATFNPFEATTAATAAPDAERLPALPVVKEGAIVKEASTGRVGLVVKTGQLPAEPNRDGDRHAVCVVWFDHVSAPIVTDQVQVIG